MGYPGLKPWGSLHMIFSSLKAAAPSALATSKRRQPWNVQGRPLRLPYARRRVTALLPLLENDRPCACGSNKEFPLSRFWIGALPKSRDGESY